MHKKVKFSFIKNKKSSPKKDAIIIFSNNTH